MSNRSFIAVIAALAVIALLGFGLLSTGTTNIALGEQAPDGPLPRLDGNGEATLADFEGNWVLVNFWASWCGPCETESPAIEAYSNSDAAENLVVVGINTEDLTDDAREFSAELGLTWEMLRDGEGERKEAFGITGLPETFLVDPEGKIALIRRGPVDEEYLETNVTPLIEAGAAEAG